MLTTWMKAHESEPEQGFSIITLSEHPTQGVIDFSSGARAGLVVQDSKELKDRGTFTEHLLQVTADDVSEGSSISEDACTAVWSGGEC